jgi:hypothetical protein
MLEERLGDADALRIADRHDAGFDGTGSRHCRYNVPTEAFPCKMSAKLLTLKLERNHIRVCRRAANNQ